MQEDRVEVDEAPGWGSEFKLNNAQAAVAQTFETSISDVSSEN